MCILPKVNSPAVIKWFGEHAVVYGKPFIGVAVGLYASAVSNDGGEKDLSISLADFDLNASFDSDRMELLYKSRKSTTSIGEFISANSDIDQRVLPFALIASRIIKGYGVKLGHKTVGISSEIPVQRGLASSAACSTSFAVALSDGHGLSDSEIIDISREGERVVHRNDGAGIVDVNTSYYGGCITYSNDLGIRKVKINENFNKCDLLLIDTGPKKSTAEMVAKVRSLYDSDRVNTEKVFNEIERYVDSGLEAIISGNVEKVGELMLKNHIALSRIGVSTPKLDDAVALAKKSGAFGAKMSGGGGGGLAVALVSKPHTGKVKLALEDGGFKVSVAPISLHGSSEYNTGSKADHGGQ